MDQQTETKVLAALYDRLFQAITYAPTGLSAPFDKATTFVQFAKNQALNPKDFANALSPANPNGDINTAEMFSRMVDVIPNICSDYSPSSNHVFDAYYNIVHGANSSVKTDPSQQDLYNQAYNYLNQQVTIKDFTGKEKTSYNKSDIYTAYCNNQTAYIGAVSAYRTAYLNYDLTKIADQRAWQANEPLLRNAVNQAYNTWRSQGADEVEQALAVLASSINSSVRNAIQQAQQDVAAQNQMSPSTTGGKPWMLSYATPTNWYDVDGIPNFSHLTLKSDNLTESQQSSYSSYSSGASASWGLWSVGGGVSGQHEDSHYHMDSDTFQLDADIAVVQVNRPWFNDLLFRMNSWYIDSANKGGISNGTLKDNDKGLLPLCPNAFVIARNVKITANWSTQDKSHVMDSITTKASVGWGPFAVSGSYSNSSSSDYFNSTFNGGTLEIPGIQIVAWVNEIIPFSAPLDPVAAQKMAAAQ
jgi:hypothetical protein